MPKKLLALFLTLGLLLAGCGQQQAAESGEPSPSLAPSPTSSPSPAADDGRFSLAWSAAAGLNPYSCTARDNRLLLPLLYEGLFVLDTAFAAQPQLCDSYSVSEDGLVWTFTLKSGLSFWDGSALTVEDVLASFTAAQSSAAYSARFADISAFAASEDGGSLQVTLSQPNGRLPNLLSFPIVQAGTEADSVPVGTGPYSLAEDQLQAYSGHRDYAQLPFSEIYLREVSSDGVAAALSSGQLDLYVQDLPEVDSLERLNQLELRHVYTTELYYFGFNVQAGRYFSNTQARLAVAQALDRDSLIQSAFLNCLTPSALPLHPATALYDSNLAAALEPQQDPAEDAAGLPAGTSDSDGLDFIVCTADSCKLAAARSFCETLQAAGYAITLRELEETEFLAELEAGNFDLYLASVRLSPDFDLSALLSSEGSLNYGGVSDLVLDGHLANFRAAGTETQAAMAAALCRYIGESCPIPIALGAGARLQPPGAQIQGLSPIGDNLFYDLCSWTVN